MATETNEIDRLAAEWAARADGDDPSDPDARALESWLAADTRHLGAYLRARTVIARVERYGLALRAQRPDLWPARVRTPRPWLLAGALAAVAIVVLAVAAAQK